MDILSNEMYEYVPDIIFKEGIVSNLESKADKSVEIIEVDICAVKDAFNKTGNLTVKHSGFDLLDGDDSNGYSTFISFRDRPIGERMKLIQKELELIKEEVNSCEEPRRMLTEIDATNSYLSEIYNNALGRMSSINSTNRSNQVNSSQLKDSMKVQNHKYELYIDPSTYTDRNIVDRVSHLATRVDQLRTIVGTDQQNECLQKRVTKLKKRMELLSKEGIDSIENKIRDFMKILIDFEASKNPLVYANRLEYVFEHGEFLKEIATSLPYIADQLKYLHKLNIDGIELVENLCNIKTNQEFCKDRLDMMKQTQQDLKQSIEENKRIFADNMKILEK